ncbi:hypothetical protein PCASD_23937 [Puccinia coronata f. sp. avenae]|uniref:Uncharacterized protein n=1 Tax=Puccinia coronata f. sp. avenae TaxID=200324 RepID=A0A2N5S9W2_9BASI|nr:hypothetical protein PCASD_23937 [Puccinia coronata f. sp. avenae]
MTATINSIFHQKNGKDSNLADAHVQCFCHKIALILSSGLKAIDLPTEILTKQNKTLGFVPAMGTISKADGPLRLIQQRNLLAKHQTTTQKTMLLPDGYSGASDSGSELEDSETQVEESGGSQSKSKILVILNKINSVIQRITSSAAKDSRFKVWCEKLDYKGPSLIAGHGI